MILRITAAALVFAFSSLLVRETGGRLGALVSLAGGVTMLLLVFPRVEGLLSEIGTIGELGESEWLRPLLRIIALGYTVEIGADLCRELGEHGCASRLELCGKIEILLLAMPSFLALLSLAVSLV
jgi:stage III sporulation protein AD